jgi:hypothetical protein
MLEADHRPKQIGEQTTTGICSPISHQKLASFFRAAATAVGDFPLLAILVYVADEYPAAYTCVGAFQAGVMRLYGVVVILGGWMRWVRGRLIHVNLLYRLAGSRGVGGFCGTIFMS